MCGTLRSPRLIVSSRSKCLKRASWFKNASRRASNLPGTANSMVWLPGVALLPNAAGYRLYIECLFDEFSTEIKVLFDRRDVASVLWPKRQTLDALLVILNAQDLSLVWADDETIGWVYQFFNTSEERKQMRGESQAPRNSRELAVRNQFFTPRYVVQFLTDNTLGRIWYDMNGCETTLVERCQYLVTQDGESCGQCVKKDPRDLRVLDPACGSGHFLLYAFDLLVTIYEEAFVDPLAPKSELTGNSISADYENIDALRLALPALILAFNLHGVDIDHACCAADRATCLMDESPTGVPRLRRRPSKPPANSQIEYRRGGAACC